MRVRLTRPQLVGVVAVASLGMIPPAVPAPAVAADEPACTGDFEEEFSTDATSLPYEQLNVDRAQEISKGGGVGIAVVDSGVSKAAGLTDGDLALKGLNSELLDQHGTLVAGLITGKDRDGKITGIAPEARLVSVRVYDKDVGKDEDSEDQDLTADGIAAGIDLAVDNADRFNIKVINVSSTTDDDRDLKEAVKRAQNNRILVVAAIGNRTDGDEEPEPYEPGEDVRTYPASYPGVLGVSAVLPLGDDSNDVSEEVLASQSTDVAAPTVGAVTAYPNDSTCVLGDVATSWSTAMVSGLAAMVFDAFPKYTPQQTARRIMETANGTTDDRSTFTGFGVIQPVEALTRDLDISKDGKLKSAEPQPEETGRAAAPEPPVDRYAAARKSFVWWGLLAGGALVLAALLRPLFSRRR